MNPDNYNWSEGREIDDDDTRSMQMLAIVIVLLIVAVAGVIAWAVLR